MSNMPDFSNVNKGSSSTATKIHAVKSGDSAADRRWCASERQLA